MSLKTMHNLVYGFERHAAGASGTPAGSRVSAATGCRERTEERAQVMSLKTMHGSVYGFGRHPAPFAIYEP
jgi:hypothetical protein